MHVKSILVRSKSDQKTSLHCPKSTFSCIFRLSVKIRHVCFYPSDTQKVDFLTLLGHAVEVCHMCPEGLLGKLKVGRKSFCLPSNNVSRLFFVRSSVRKSHLKSKSSSQSSGNVENTEKMQKSVFWPYFTCINLRLAGRPFEKPKNWSKTCLSTV